MNEAFYKTNDKTYAFFQKLLQKHDLIGLGVGIIHNDQIVVNDIATLPNTKQIDFKQTNLFRVASISKLFVATAIMQLQEKGLLNIDDPINQHLDFHICNPYYPHVDLTIKMFLTHTSSLIDTQTLYIPYPETLKELYEPTGRYYTTKMFLKKENQAVKPGTMYEYYNTGFSILAAIIEICSQERFDQYIERHILQPLEMKGSFHKFDSYTKINLHPLYRKEEDEWIEQVDGQLGVEQDYTNYRLGSNPTLFSPQGGLRSNTTELLKFMRMLLSNGQFQQHQILQKRSINLMTTIHFADTHTSLDEDDFYRNNGLSFNIVSNKTLNKPLKDMPFTMVGHSGIAYGLLAVLYVDIEHKNGLVFLTMGHGKTMDAYKGTYSQFYNFQEEMFTFCNDKYWSKKEDD